MSHDPLLNVKRSKNMYRTGIAVGHSIYALSMHFGEDIPITDEEVYMLIELTETGQVLST